MQKKQLDTNNIDQYINNNSSLLSQLKEFRPGDYNRMVEINDKVTRLPAPSPFDINMLENISTVEEYIEHMNKYGSGQFITHSFPEISLKNGIICTGLGAKNFTDDEYQRTAPSVLESESNIYFTVGDTGFKRVYTYASFGTVFFPMESLLENYAYKSLPLDDEKEWIIHAPVQNPQSTLHKIPLKMGILFIPEINKAIAEKLLAALLPDQRPNKIIYYSHQNQGGPEALEQITKNIKKSQPIPKMYYRVEIIDSEKSTSTYFKKDSIILGTKKAQVNWVGSTTLINE
jgi:hypothetical protein